MIKDSPTFVQFRDAVSEHIANDADVQASVADSEDSNLVLRLWMLQFSDLDPEDAEAISKTIRETLEFDVSRGDMHKLRLALGAIGYISYQTAGESPTSIEITVLSHDLIYEGLEVL